MREEAEPAAATAVLSVWIEGDRPGVLKIRLTSVSRLGSPDRAIGVTTSIPEAVKLVPNGSRHSLLDMIRARRPEMRRGVVRGRVTGSTRTWQRQRHAGSGRSKSNEGGW